MVIHSKAPPHRGQPEGRLQFHAGRFNLGQLRARSTPDRSLHQTARRDLERYYQTLERELLSLPFGPDEGLLIARAMSGHSYGEERSYELIHSDVRHYLRQHPDAMHGDEAAEMESRLADLGPGAIMALVDAVERWWDGGCRGPVLVAAGTRIPAEGE